MKVLHHGELQELGLPADFLQQPGATMLVISSRSCINQRPSRCNIARATSMVMAQDQAAAAHQSHTNADGQE